MDREALGGMIGCSSFVMIALLVIGLPLSAVVAWLGFEDAGDTIWNVAAASWFVVLMLHIIGMTVATLILFALLVASPFLALGPPIARAGRRMRHRLARRLR